MRLSQICALSECQCWVGMEEGQTLRAKAGGMLGLLLPLPLQVQVWAHVCSPYRVGNVLEEGGPWGQRHMTLWTPVGQMPAGEPSLVREAQRRQM